MNIFELSFNTPFQAAESVVKSLSVMNDEYPTICIFGKYDVIKDIFQELIKLGINIDGCVELEDSNIDEYWKEFTIYLTIDGVSVVKSWCDYNDAYYDYECDIAFIHDDCNSKLLKSIDSLIRYEFSIGEDDCECDECECCDELDECESTDKSVTYTKDDDGNTHGFTVSRSDGNSCYGVSFYSTDKLSMKDIQSLMQECGF